MAGAINNKFWQCQKLLFQLKISFMEIKDVLIIRINEKLETSLEYL